MKYKAEDVQYELECNAIGCDVRDDYSGRFMYGKECPGVEADNMNKVFSMLVSLAASQPEMAKHLAARAKIDNMGQGIIVYWPDITYEREAVR